MPQLKAKHLLTLFILLHITSWTIAPTWVRINLPMDSLEGAAWGEHWQFGYDRNPFLNAWITQIAVHLSDYGAWSIYLCSQLSVGLGMFMIWQLARQILTENLAVLSVLILEGVQYYHFHAIDFNDNNLELSLWPLTIYFFYQACQLKHREGNIYWLLTGTAAALAMLAKYYTAALLAAMFLFLLLPANRHRFRQEGIYLGLGVFFILLMPHVIWLFNHDFVTVNYVFDRAASPPTWLSHIVYATSFAWDQTLAFLPAFILALLAYVIGLAEKNVPQQVEETDKFNRQFLWFIGTGPFIFTLLLSLSFGIYLRAGWGMPLLALWGILLLSYLKPALTRCQLQRFFIGILLLMMVLVIGYSQALLHSDTTSSANFPGQKIANTINRQWHARFHTPLTYVAGSRFIANNIHFYSPDHPHVFLEWNTLHSPWINSANMRKSGAVFVWDISRGESLPAEIKAQYPALQIVPALFFNWLRDDNHNFAPVDIGIAYLPPAKKRGLAYISSSS